MRYVKSFYIYDDKIVITGSDFKYSSFWVNYEFSYEDFIKEANDKNQLYRL